MKLDREVIAKVLFNNETIIRDKSEALYVADKIIAELEKASQEKQYCECLHDYTPGVGIAANMVNDELVCNICRLPFLLKPPKNKASQEKICEHAYTTSSSWNYCIKCGELYAPPKNKIEPLDWGNGVCKEIPSILNIAEKVDEIISVINGEGKV